jgi:hypothetical protein
VVAQAQVYLADHPELFDQAMERVRASPWHRAMVEREQRERVREDRKLARAGVVENPSVCDTGSAKSAIDLTR